MKVPFRGCNLSVISWVLLLLFSKSSLSEETLQCSICLQNYQEQNGLASFTLSMQCGGQCKLDDKYKIKSIYDNNTVISDNASLPTNAPFLLGLTTTTATPDADTYDDKGREYDFALQPFKLEKTSQNLDFTFHAQLSDIAGMRYVVAKAWPLSFLQNCSDGRSGCKKFGYALAAPPSCFTKDANGEKTAVNSPECTPSEFYLFKFR